MNDWEEYTTEDEQGYIPIRIWGQDHWSTLAYVHACAVNGSPLDNRRLRVNARVHREFAANIVFTGSGVQDCPTRLADNETEENHDDISCIEDAVAAGLLRVWTRDKTKHRFSFEENADVVNDMFDCMEIKTELTELGWTVFRALTGHKNNGGAWATFRWST